MPAYVADELSNLEGAKMARPDGIDEFMTSGVSGWVPAVLIAVIILLVALMLTNIGLI